MAYPIPADAGVAVATEPMWIDHAPVTFRDHRGPLANQCQRGDRHHEAQPLQGLPIASALYDGPRVRTRSSAEVQSLLRVFSMILVIEAASLVGNYY